MKKYAAFLALGLSLGFTSCTKCDEDTTAPEPTRAELLTSNTWRPVSRITTTTSNSTTGSSHNSNTFQSCDADDFIQFQASGTFKYEDGSFLCDPNFVKAFSSTWAFTSNDTKIQITKDSKLLTEGEILELTTDKLVLKTIRTEDNNTYTYLETYLPL